jgi:hypothetical protein
MFRARTGEARAQGGGGTVHHCNNLFTHCSTTVRTVSPVKKILISVVAAAPTAAYLRQCVCVWLTEIDREKTRHECAHMHE